MYDIFKQKISNLRSYEKTVLEYEAQPIEAGKILFYGSSGFARWNKETFGVRPLEEDIRMKDGSPAAVNHGFGGGIMEQGLYYYDRLVKPWAPRAIVLRFFPNDIMMGYSPMEIMYLTAQFCNRARADFPGGKLHLCDAMPHKKFMDNPVWKKCANQYNQLLHNYCELNEDCTYVAQSNWPGFYENPEDAGDYSKIRTDIWVEDELHFTQEGYDIYRDLFLSALDDIL